MIKIQYKQLSDFTTAQTIQKIANTPTSVANANRIRKLVKELQGVRERVSKEYQTEIVDKFADKDENGKAKTDGNSPSGFAMSEENTAKMPAALEEFGKTEAEIEAMPLNASCLSDVKLSATELESLHGMYLEEAGPGLPGSLR